MLDSTVVFFYCVVQTLLQAGVFGATQLGFITLLRVVRLLRFQRFVIAMQVASNADDRSGNFRRYVDALKRYLPWVERRPPEDAAAAEDVVVEEEEQVSAAVPQAGGRKVSVKPADRKVSIVAPPDLRRASRGASTGRHLPLHMISDDEVSSSEDEAEGEPEEAAHEKPFAARWTVGSAWHLEQRWGGVHSLAAMLHHHHHTGEEGAHPEKHSRRSTRHHSVAGQQLRELRALRAATPSTESKLPAIQEGGSDRGGRPTLEHPGRQLSNRGGSSERRNGSPSNPRVRPFSMTAWDAESGQERAVSTNELSA